MRLQTDQTPVGNEIQILGTGGGGWRGRGGHSLHQYRGTAPTGRTGGGEWRGRGDTPCISTEGLLQQVGQVIEDGGGGGDTPCISTEGLLQQVGQLVGGGVRREDEELGHLHQ